MDKNSELMQELKMQLKQRKLIQNGICEVCGETNPLALQLFEKHHIFSKEYSDEDCLLCRNCHYIVTQGQNLFSPRMRSRKLPQGERLMFVLLSHTLLEKRMAESKNRVIHQIGGGGK